MRRTALRGAFALSLLTLTVTPAFGQPPDPTPYRPGDVPPAAGWPYVPPPTPDPYPVEPPVGRAPFDPSYPVYPSYPTVPAGSGRITALADRLAGQAESFLRAFSTTGGVVPQSRSFVADATRLRDAAARLRGAAASGAPPSVLASEFTRAARAWRRLEGRMARVSRGRLGPNIATALQMGATVDQLARLLP